MTDAQPRTKAVMESGILPDSVIDQMRKWGLVTSSVDKNENLNASDVAGLLQSAVESESAVQLRDTDLDIVTQYLNQQSKGRLYFPTPSEDPNSEDRVSFTEVFFCPLLTGEYVIPWQGESIRDLLLDPRAYLKPSGGEKIHFADVRDLFFGDTKAFIVCRPDLVTEEL